MNCGNVKKLIHLNKKGELSDDEKKMLNQHLSNCDSCRELMRIVENADNLIQNLKSVEPDLDYPQVLTSNIMQSIKKKEKPDNVSFLLSIVLDFVLSKKVRILAYAIVIGLIGLFSYQQILIMNKLNQMEKMIAAKSNENDEISTNTLVVNKRVLNEFVTEVKDEQLVINKESFNRFIKSYKNLKTGHDELLELLNDNMKYLENKLTEKDIQKLKQLLNEGDLEENLSTNL